MVDRIVELANPWADESDELVSNQAGMMSGGDGLGERVDLLVSNLFVDDRREQASSEERILRLLGGQEGGGLDREPVELLRRRSVVEAADRLRGDAERVDGAEAVATASDRAHDLLDFNGFKVSVSLFDLHVLSFGQIGADMQWPPEVQGPLEALSSVPSSFEISF